MYDLYMHNDLRTDKHTQWFYFRYVTVISYLHTCIALHCPFSQSLTLIPSLIPIQILSSLHHHYLCCYRLPPLTQC